METRINYNKVDEGANKALMGVAAYVGNSGLEESLLDLVVLRASQVNGCAFCIDMHTKDARASGETEQRLYLLDAWRDTNFYSEREQAALAWTEAVTVLTEGHVPDAVYEQARQQFTEKELVALTMAIIAINGWNRLNVAFRSSVGWYQSRRQPAEAAVAQN